MTSELKYPCTHEEGLAHRRNVARSQLSEEAKAWLDAQEHSLTALQILFLADKSDLPDADVTRIFLAVNDSPATCQSWLNEAVKCDRSSWHKTKHCNGSIGRLKPIKLEWTDT